MGIDGAEPALDYVLNFNTSLVTGDSKSGMSLYGFNRNRNPFDANGDDFSEIAQLRNTTLGSRIFHRFGKRSKLAVDFFNINEDRRGGNKFDLPEHKADIAESVKHTLTTGAISFERYFRTYDKFMVYASGQSVKRKSYYGAEQSLKDYGQTNDFTYNIGAQYYLDMPKASLVFGTEYTAAVLKDEKMGYPDFENAVIVNDSIVSIPYVGNTLIAHQSTHTTGVFAQYELTLDKLLISAGLRFDNFAVLDHDSEHADKRGQILSPRLSLKYDIQKYLQARLSYSQGYRAPQIFDEDLHIETSGSRKIIHRNNDDLKQEESQSIMASIDFNKEIGNRYLGILVEGFYTSLDNPFITVINDPNANGVVVFERQNGDNPATIQGINLEVNYLPIKEMALKAGFTIQSSKFGEAIEFDEKRFFRTPSNYGYFTLDYQIGKKLGFSGTGNYTGNMLVPYFGESLADQDTGELRESDPFFDLGLKLRYDIKINGATLRLLAGVKNVLNSYQSDFDSGINRDPAYIYGPMNPRTLYLGFKIGNFLP